MKLPRRNKEGGNEKKGGTPVPKPFWNNALTAVFVFIVLMTIYSFLTESGSKVPTITLSQLAGDVSAGFVSKITVHGDALDVEYLKDHECLTESGINLGHSIWNDFVKIDDDDEDEEE